MNRGWEGIVTMTRKDKDRDGDRDGDIPAPSPHVCRTEIDRDMAVDSL